MVGVSTDIETLIPAADTVLAGSPSTSVPKNIVTHIYLAPGETGLEQSVLKAADIALVPESRWGEPARMSGED